MCCLSFIRHFFSSSQHREFQGGICWAAKQPCNGRETVEQAALSLEVVHTVLVKQDEVRTIMKV